MILYKIIHRLFGWDYIYWENTADQGIARVCVDGMGNAYYWQYKITRLAKKIDSDNNWDNIIWLTCSPDKYVKKQDGQ